MLDVVDPASIEALIDGIASDIGPVSILVNNAGITRDNPLMRMKDEDWQAILDTNLTSVYRTSKAVMRAMMKARRGRIINIASVTALLPERFNGVYSGSKAYLINFSQALQEELRPHGVRVQAVLPGATRTAIWGAAVDHLPKEMLMEVDEMVDAALAGFDQGEPITIPSLPDPADWQAYTAARLHMAPRLSLQHAAARYQPAPAVL